MKKMVMAMTMLLASMTAMAQDADNRAGRPERRQFNQAEMIQHRTERTVQKYGLDENQAKQLQELNTKYANVLGGPRGGRGFRPGGPRQGRVDRDSMNRERPSRADMEKRREEMQKEMEAYSAELKKIMNEEQFKAYQADMEKMRNNNGRRPQGQRPHKNNDYK